MPTKGKKGKGKRTSKSAPENDDGCIEDPPSSKVVQRMASKTLSSSARKLGDKENVDRHQVETSQSSLWLSKSKVYMKVVATHLWLFIYPIATDCTLNIEYPIPKTFFIRMGEGMICLTIMKMQCD